MPIRDQINPFCNRMVLDFDSFVSSIDTCSINPEFNRAVRTIIAALRKSKNVAWEEP